MSDIADYAQYAVDLVNSAAGPLGRDELTEPADVLRLLREDAHTFASRVGAHEVVALRAFRDRFRAVFVKAAAGQDQGAAEELNGILAVAQFRPELTNHDGTGWHLHLSRGRASVTGIYVATAAMGLLAHIAAGGLGRLGVCLADGCCRVFIDTSTNHSRRYCSQRCSTRQNVAAFRARQRA